MNDNGSDKPPLAAVSARMQKDLRALDGKVVDMAEAAGILNDKNRQLNEATRLGLMVSRITRAIGHRVDQRIALGACYVVIAKLIAFSPPERHHGLLQAMIDGVSAALYGLYPPEIKARIQKQIEEEARKAVDNLKSGPPPGPAGDTNV